MSGFSGSSTGDGAGFTQSSNAFGGLNNTDLRPGRRRRRPVPLLDTAWVINRRKRGPTMLRKDVTGLVETLRTSVLGISTSESDDREGLLTKSFSEFDAALQAHLDERFGEDPEVLAKGLNHISAFAQSLASMNRTVSAMKTGRPSYMIDGGDPPEELPEEIKAQLDRFIMTGIFTLRAMVNDTAELPETDEAVKQAEQAGHLMKLATDHGEILIKTELPEDLRQYMTNEVDVMLDAADLGRSFMGDANLLADHLLKNSPEVVTEELAEAYPELFLIETGSGNDTGAEMGKAFPPPKKKPDAAAATGGGQGGEQENVGQGGDPDDDAAEQTDTGDGTAVTDDTPQNPLEMITRLASIIVVIGGSLMQGQGTEDDGSGDEAGAGAVTDDRNVGLARSEPIASVPLEKILKGEVAVNPTLADALEELIDLRKKAPDMAQELNKKDEELTVLKATLARFEKTEAQPRGVRSTVALGKTDDTGVPAQGAEANAAEIDRLRKENPSGAAVALIKMAHSTGGRPLIP